MKTLRYITSRDSRTLALSGRVFLIGSSSECDFVLSDKNIAACAVRIEIENVETESFALTALPFASVILNGKKTKKARLRPGDRIEIGSEVFIFDHHDRSPDQSANDLDTLLTPTINFANAIASENDIRRLLVSMLRMLQEVLRATDAFIIVCDAAGAYTVFASSNSDNVESRFSDSIVQHVVKTRQPIVVPNLLVDSLFSAAQSVAELKLKTVVCCPILSTDRTLGVMYCGSKAPTASFDRHELHILTFYASLASLLICHLERIERQQSAIRSLTKGSQRPGIIGESKAMLDALYMADRICDSELVVLIEGETGAGKDVLAGYIHAKSKRAAGPMVVVNCSALRQELLESELFGHKKGSFTGAHSDHDGLFRAADGGTLFLDEIGEMSIEVQAKLLRAIETGRIRPVGSAEEMSVSVRIICATNRSLSEMSKNGTFRQDLYFRLNQFGIRLPPLRERGNDILLLASFFLEKLKARHPEKQVVGFHPDAMRALMLYEWPGNVRELAAAIEKALFMSDGPYIKLTLNEFAEPVPDFESATLRFQNGLIHRALEFAGGNKDEAARLLNIHRTTFYRYLATEKGQQ
jgi:transcriptional regulator with GAF, ATPase, and Fis domain